MISILLQTPAIPIWLEIVFALAAGFTGVIVLIKTIRNSKDPEFRAKIDDIKHENEQNKKIADVEAIARHIKSEIQTLKNKIDLFEGSQKTIEQLEKRIERLEKLLDELLILLGNAGK